MFAIIRILIGALFFGVCALIIRSSKKTNKHRKYAVVFLVAVAISTLSAFIPFENAFYTFEAPHKAFEYVNGKASNVTVIEGENSDLVMGDKNGTTTYLIISKTDSGWKIGRGIDTKKIAQKIHNGFIICVYQYKDTSDFFVDVFNANNTDMTITDSFNSEFIEIKEDKYYSNIHNFDSNYQIVINGEKITIE